MSEGWNETARAKRQEGTNIKDMRTDRLRKDYCQTVFLLDVPDRRQDQQDLQYVLPIVGLMRSHHRRLQYPGFSIWIYLEPLQVPNVVYCNRSR
jgi:hypothetical protein